MLINQEFARRRQRLMDRIGKGGLAFLFAAPECYRTSDTEYYYRPNSDFYYMTGFSEPDAVAVFVPGRSQGEFILFNRERNPDLEIWSGPRAGQTGALEVYQADQSYPISEIDSIMPQLIENCRRIYYPIGQQVAWDNCVNEWIKKIKRKSRQGIRVPEEYLNIEKILHELRLRKSPYELELIKKAASITSYAHCRAMQVCKPGMYEYELEAEITYEFLRRGSRSAAYNTIVGGGINSCILHYVNNAQILKEGDLVLIDAGCEYEYYASDVTRTFPVSGHFSREQQALYEIVLNAQLSAIQLIKPGVKWLTLQDAAAKIITQGLIDLDLLEGDVEELVNKQAYRAFYMHNIGHWLGLDVHDVGDYKINGEWRGLEPGMVLTVEPGIYIGPHQQTVDKKWRGMGIRIEDDVLVTENGCEVLTKDIPKTVNEIIHYMNK